MIVRKYVPSLALIVLFVILVHGYNQWAGLDQIYLVRRTIAAAGLGVLIFGPAILVRRQYLYLAIASFLVSGLFILHLVYTSYAGGFFSVSALKYSWQLQSLGSNVKTLLGPQLLFFLTPLAAIAILFAVRPRSATKIQLPKTLRIGTLAVILVLPLLSAGYVMAGEVREQGNLKALIQHPFNSDELVRKIGIINYSLVDSAKYMLRKKNLTPEERSWVQAHRDQYRFKPQGVVQFGSQHGKNVIYLQLESFQEFVIGLQVNGQPVTPNLNKLAAEGLHFTNFHYMIGPGTSSDAEFTALNSLIYPGDSAAFFEYPGNNYHALPELLRESGYSTTAMHGDSRNFWNRLGAYPALGYDRYLGIESYAPTERGQPWGMTDKEFLAQSVPKLVGLKSPYYAHIITLTSHLPFKLPPKDQGLNLAGVPISETQQGYLQSVHYTDAMLGQFLDALRARGDLDRTLLVVTGDHEGFIAKKTDTTFAKFLGYANGFDDLSFLRTQQVPLVIHGTGLVPQTFDAPGSHLDIYPTVTNLLGLKTPPTVLGTDLLNTSESLVARRRRGSGIDLEMALTKNLSYVGSKTSSSFDAGACYQDQVKVALELCRPVYQQAYDRVQLSDLLVKGNALDLLK